MKKFIVRKKAFFYTDEALSESKSSKGSLIGIYNSLEGARIAKKQADIKSMRNCGGYHTDDFIFNSKNYGEIQEELREYYIEEMKCLIPKNNRFKIPDQLDEEMAMDFLEILEFSFHIILEYSDGDNIFKSSDVLNNEELSEF